MGNLTRLGAILFFCTAVSSGGCSMLVEVVNRKQGNQSLSENPSSPCSSLLHRLLPGEKLPQMHEWWSVSHGALQVLDQNFWLDLFLERSEAIHNMQTLCAKGKGSAKRLRLGMVVKSQEHSNRVKRHRSRYVLALQTLQEYNFKMHTGENTNHGARICL